MKELFIKFFLFILKYLLGPTVFLILDVSLREPGVNRLSELGSGFISIIFFVSAFYKNPYPPFTPNWLFSALPLGLKGVLNVLNVPGKLIAQFIEIRRYGETNTSIVKEHKDIYETAGLIFSIYGTKKDLQKDGSPACKFFTDLIAGHLQASEYMKIDEENNNLLVHVSIDYPSIQSLYDSLKNEPNVHIIDFREQKAS